MSENEKERGAVEIDPNWSARTRLLAAGSAVFLQDGYKGASVRRICRLAGTTSNMIHHYFGSKQGLYDEILSGLSEGVLVVPLRIIDDAPRSVEDFALRLELFIKETLEALIAHRNAFELVVRERIVFDIFRNYGEKLVWFLETAKTDGFVRAELDSQMLTGLVLDRLGNQIIYGPWLKKIGGHDIQHDAAYKKRWLRANLDLILHGVAMQPK